MFVIPALFVLLFLTGTVIAQASFGAYIPTGGYPDSTNGGLFSWTGSNYQSTDSEQMCTFFMDKPFEVSGTVTNVYFYSGSGAQATIQFLIVRLQTGVLNSVSIVASASMSYTGYASPGGGNSFGFGSTVNVIPGDILGICQKASIIPYTGSSSVTAHISQYPIGSTFPFPSSQVFAGLVDEGNREYPCFAYVTYVKPFVGYPVAYYAGNKDVSQPFCNFFPNVPFPPNSIPDTFYFFIVAIPSSFYIYVMNSANAIITYGGGNIVSQLGINTVYYFQINSAPASTSYTGAYFGFCSDTAAVPYSNGNSGTPYVMYQQDTTAHPSLSASNVLNNAYQLTGRSYAIEATYTCNPGYYDYDGVCSLCPAGFGCSNGVSYLCGAGTYSATTGQSGCTQCSPGSYQPDAESTGCASCSAGSFSSFGATVCTSCSTGTYQPSAGQGSCINCPSGSFQSLPGSTTTCTLCSSGTFQPNTEQSFCGNCSPGTYQSSQGQSSCTNCLPGYFQTLSQSTSCSACPAGTFQSNPGQSFCGNCLANTYSSRSNSTICFSCPVGTQSSVGASTCTAIPGFTTSVATTTAAATTTSSSATGSNPATTSPAPTTLRHNTSAVLSQQQQFSGLTLTQLIIVCVLAGSVALALIGGGIGWLASRHHTGVEYKDLLKPK
jgi:hypothetical protein